MPGPGQEQSAVAVVIGRAGSKGLPGKNARMLAGQPMIAYSVRDALEAELVKRVYCSTDGDDIADAATGAGATVVMRPPELADDHATVDSAVRHALDAEGDTTEIVVILYGNVPVRPAGLVDRAIRKLQEDGADSVQSYSPVGKYHPFWMTRIDEQDRVGAWQENRIHRRQDLPLVFIPDGGVIVVRRATLFRADTEQPHAFLGEDRRGLRNPLGSVVDVDDEIDLRVAEAMLESRRVMGEVGA
ncbi:MAG: acylneuraminate cytidylyltransferase family protein [Phycisphaerales bacterium]|nr:acylneuraminate cytidylyltransferase family protein [Phycisphaerales bacterium]